MPRSVTRTGSPAPALLETVGQVVRDPDQADEAALADHPCSRVQASRRIFSGRAGRRSGGGSSGHAIVSSSWARSPAAWAISVESSLRGFWAAATMRICSGLYALPPVRRGFAERTTARRSPSRSRRDTCTSIACSDRGAAAQVFGCGLGREIVQFASFSSDAPGDPEQAVAVVGDGAHRCGSGGIAAQRDEVDEAYHYGLGLVFEGPDGTELRHSASPPRGVAASGQR